MAKIIVLIRLLLSLHSRHLVPIVSSIDKQVKLEGVVESERYVAPEATLPKETKNQIPIQGRNKIAVNLRS